ncbi:hypothetical protein GR138_20940 [Shinella kummerowiae]|uniref:Uncharacterized protein n=1 Tax=Shinella kummerowiae TaxID=417745 RepID=A0A6N8SF24_9HYPH|nr:methylamine utilization protein MauJ [Shinella kummerowiae]MXN47674.1 hypothetical protein [Shinella kummerowiae]
MYARDLMIWLHDRLAERGTLDQTKERFESLRRYNLLPQGRENAGVRISNKQIANAILGFAHYSSGYAGHVSLILGDLRPVGGINASFRNAANLQDAVAILVSTDDDGTGLLRLTLSVEQDFTSDEFAATLRFRNKDKTRTVSFVSKYALSLFNEGAENKYDHDRLDKLTAVERSFGAKIFRDLSRTVSISRQLDRPFKTDWREYETEEEKAAFHRKLGARQSSRFLNLRADTQVTWPKEPTRMEFGGHHLILFPKTKDNSHSVSIDLIQERMSQDAAATLINRMLSVMSWCNDQPASLHEGWSGSPVPAPVPKKNLASTTINEWYFYRTLPTDENLLRCLAYYRDALNAYSVGLASHSVLSFFRVFETRYDTKKKVTEWVNAVFPDIEPAVLESALKAFEADRQLEQVDIGTYVYHNCRVATAHAARDFPSDPDRAEESRRLLNASRIMQSLARFFIKQEFNFSTTYLTDNPN